MKRTLLAVGVAVLVSMLLAPHGDKNSIKGFGPFFSDYTLGIERETVPDWAAANNGEDSRDAPDWAKPKPATRQHLATRYVGRVMIDMLALEIVFLAALFAVVVNVRWPWKKERGQSQ